MTATLTEQNHILLKPGTEDVARVTSAEGYHVMVSTAGVITLRPKRKHQKSLVEHLRGLEGLELKRRRDPIPKPIEL